MGDGNSDSKETTIGGRASTPGARSKSNRFRTWKLPQTARDVFGNSTVQVALSVLSVLILLLSSSDLSSLRLPSAHFSTASGGLPSSANATGYLPYLLNASAFPLPSPLLNGSGGATLPQLTMTPSSAASVEPTRLRPDLL